MIILNFTLNKFLPFLLIGFLSFYSLGFFRFEPYVILGLAIFIGRFNFNAGYAVAYCEKNNIDLKNVE
jgi:hypothetical protein